MKVVLQVKAWEELGNCSEVVSFCRTLEVARRHGGFQDLMAPCARWLTGTVAYRHREHGDFWGAVAPWAR